MKYSPFVLVMIETRGIFVFGHPVTTQTLQNVHRSNAAHRLTETSKLK
jgi:hypothetical protein